MIKLKTVGSVCSDLLGSVCSGQVGSISTGQVGSLSAEFPLTESQNVKSAAAHRFFSLHLYFRKQAFHHFGIN